MGIDQPEKYPYTFKGTFRLLLRLTLLGVLVFVVWLGGTTVNYLIHKDVMNSDALMSRGIWYIEHDQPLIGLDYLNRALELNPENIPAHQTRGLLMVDGDAPEVAITDLTTVIDGDMATAETYIGRGRAYALLEDYPSAIADFDQAEVMAPYVGLLYAYRGMTYEEMGENDRAQADYETFLTFYLIADDDWRDMISARLEALGQPE